MNTNTVLAGVFFVIALAWALTYQRRNQAVSNVLGNVGGGFVQAIGALAPSGR